MKNDFAKLAHRLIGEAGVKMINISHATGYDLSYVSKWMSGKVLPSEKTIERVVRSIAECILFSAEADRLETLKDSYACSDTADLRQAMEDDLMLAYASSKGITGKNMTELFPSISVKDMLQRVREMNRNAAGDFVAIVDLFRLSHEARLEFAGIYEGRLEKKRYQHISQAVVVTCIADVSDVIYDCLYLLHLISTNAGRQFSIYNSRIADGKILYIADQNVSVSGLIFPGEKSCTGVSISADPAASKHLHQTCMQQVSRGNAMMHPMNIREFVLNKDYLKSMLSEDNRWLIGHVTEHILPQDLFDQFLNEIHVDDPSGYRAVHDLAQGVIQRGAVSIMLYETVLSDLLATREIDFFNHRIRFTGTQMARFLEHLLQINETNANFKVIKNGFSIHFEHLYNPCLFISGTNIHMRLENAYEHDNIIVFIDRDTKQLISRFYDKAWSERPDIVLHEKSEIKRILTHYCEMNALLSNG